MFLLMMSSHVKFVFANTIGMKPKCFINTKSFVEKH